MVGGLLDPGGRGRVQPPFEDGPIDHDRSGNLAMLRTLGLGPGVDEQGAVCELGGGLLRLNPNELPPGVF